MEKTKVFLGGTCNESTWREKLIPLLKVDYFNPVVDDWTPECQAEEERQKELCNVHLYVITPKMTGVFSVAEVVDSSNKNPDGTILMILTEDNGAQFSEGQIRSLRAVGNMVKNNGGRYYFGDTMPILAHYLNRVTVIKPRETKAQFTKRLLNAIYRSAIMNPDKYFWVPVTERLPLAPEYDWVLVRTMFSEGGRGVPKVAEIRNGKWYCNDCEGPMEETLALEVTDWFDMKLIKDHPASVLDFMTKTFHIPEEVTRESAELEEALDVLANKIINKTFDKENTK